MITFSIHRRFAFFAATAIAAAFVACLASIGWSETPAAPVGAGPLHNVLQSVVDKQLAAGVVLLVADKDKVLDLEAAGYSSLASKTPMQVDNVFWLASMSKSFTSSALMMLVDEGKVNINDPVEKYLPEFKGQKLAAEKDADARPPIHPIVVKEIMSHTSGMVLASDKAARSTYLLKDNVAKYASIPLRHEPGAKYEYNNCGIDTGGRIIEVLSGQSYADFMQSRLFEPLGLKDTTFWPSEEQAARLARSARFTADKTGIEEVKLVKDLPQVVVDRLRKGTAVPPAMLSEFGVGTIFDYANRFAEPAGGLFSTAADVGKFCQMLLNGGVYQGKRYLSDAAIKQMTSVQTGSAPMGKAESYGLGWSVKLNDEEGPAAGSFGHRGARRPVMWIDPKNGLVLVVLVERFDMTGAEQKIFYGSILKSAVAKFGKVGE